MRPSPIPGGLLFVGLMFALLGGSMLASAALLLHTFASNALQVLRAERVPMTILSSDTDAIYHLAETRRDFTEIYYRPSVAYAYEVGGAKHTGYLVSPLAAQGGPRWARLVSARYQAGQTHLGYYLPDDPQTAFLSWTVHPAPLLMSGLAASMSMTLLVPAAGIARTIRDSRRAARPAPAVGGGGPRRERRQRQRAMADPRPAWIDLRRYVVGMPPGAAPRIFVAAGSSAVLLAFSLERWRTGGILLLALWATRRLL